MTDDEMKDLARVLVQGQAVDFSFLFLSTDEDDMIADMTETELEDLYDLITSAMVTLSWPGTYLTLDELKALPVGTRVECEDGYDIFHSVFGWVVLCNQDEWATSPAGADHMLLRRPVKVREDQW